MRFSSVISNWKHSSHRLLRHKMASSCNIAPGSPDTRTFPQKTMFLLNYFILSFRNNGSVFCHFVRNNQAEITLVSATQLGLEPPPPQPRAHVRVTHSLFVFLSLSYTHMYTHAHARTHTHTHMPLLPSKQHPRRILVAL